jgi:hypothetical protein
MGAVVGGSWELCIYLGRVYAVVPASAPGEIEPP